MQLKRAAFVLYLLACLSVGQALGQTGPNPSSGSGGDSITSPNGTLTIGGTASATTVDIATTGNPQINSFGVNVAATTTAGEINAVGGTANLYISESKISGYMGIWPVAAASASSSNYALASNGGTTALLNASSSDSFQISGTTNVTVANHEMTMVGGATFQSAGGTTPSCSAATGTCAVASNTNCTGSATPWPQCTGSGTGTVSTSTNNRGEIHLTGGSAVTSITLTFSASGLWGQAPYCTFTQAGAAAVPLAYSSPLGSCASTSACVITLASATTADIAYTCL
jgi:hypothetical protein